MAALEQVSVSKSAIEGGDSRARVRPEDVLVTRVLVQV